MLKYVGFINEWGPQTSEATLKSLDSNYEMKSKVSELKKIYYIVYIYIKTVC